MPELDYVAHVETLETPELISWISGWKPGCYQRVIGELELQKRRDRSGNLRAWIAIAISATALIFSVLTFLLRK